MPFDSSFMAASGARGVERNGIVTGLEQNPSTVLVAARARVYHTKLNTKDSQWVYSRWKGTLTFGKDIETPNSIPRDISETERHWFRLADDETGRTVWMFKFPEQFEYGVDRPFFHVFQGRTRRYGFLFDDDDDASVFGKMVMERLSNGRGSPFIAIQHVWTNVFHKRDAEPPRKSRTNSTKGSGATRSKSLSSAISRSMISSPAPQSFKHIAHVGVNKDGVFEASKEVDSTWRSMLQDLQGHGVSEVLVRQSNFGDGFWKGVDAIRMVEGSDTERFGSELNGF